jgi:hypothetical protein
MDSLRITNRVMLAPTGFIGFWIAPAGIGLAARGKSQYRGMLSFPVHVLLVTP